METISAKDLKQRIDAGEAIHLIDVREPHEYKELNMGGTLIPLGQLLNGEIDAIEALRAEEVIIHCRSGVRSMQACMVLEQMGFQKTVNVAGGILAWKEL